MIALIKNSIENHLNSMIGMKVWIVDQSGEDSPLAAGRAATSLDDAEQLFDRSPTLNDLAQAVLLQVDHAVLAGLDLDLVDRRILADHVAHRLVDDHQLVDAGPAEVARAAALGADLLGILGA